MLGARKPAVAPNVTLVALDVQHGRPCNASIDQRRSGGEKKVDGMTRRGLFLCIGTVLAILAAGCSAPVDTSKARSRAVIESGGIAPAEELRVAEYLGYYKQSFPAPTSSTLGLDLRLGNPQVPVEGGQALLQVGVQARAAQSDMIAPLNLAIVIDRSGSMDTPEKMPYLKQSLKVFLHSLAANDQVALIAFSDSAEVVVPSTRVGDGRWIDEAVDKLRPAGGTNMHAGMVAGFKEVERGFDVRRNNRVIVLTDGIANIGVTSPDQIAQDAREYNDRGINLSTIGLGRDFNDALLIKLANQGKGAYHYVDSAAEMDKVFKTEVSGLVQKAAGRRDGRRPPRAGRGGRVDHRLRGQAGGRAGAGAAARHGQVVLVGLRVEPGATGRRAIGSVELRYQDQFSKREESTSKTVVAEAGRVAGYDPAWDVEVLRNVTIQATAEGLREIDRLYMASRYLDAWRLAQRLEGDLNRVARLANDDQLSKDAATMRRYEDTLAKWVERQTGRPPQAVAERAPAPTELPLRGREPLPTPIEPR
jgi:hypothetical protein